jgi:putative transposase
MKRSRFSEEQIIGILKEHEAGVSVADLCRKYGVSDASIYKWKAKFGGMDVSEAKRRCIVRLSRCEGLSSVD